VKYAAIMFLAGWFCFSPLSALAAGSTSAAHSGLASYDWSVKASPNLESYPPPQTIVESFFSSVQTSVWGDSDLGSGESVCSFRFVDLRHDGVLSLVAGIGVTERSCSNIYIVDKTASSLEIYLSGGANDAGRDVSARIADLRHDGSLEFLIEDELGSITGQCSARWIAIYAWTGSNYTNVSDRFRDFYQQRLDSLNKKTSALQPFKYKGASYEPPEKECLEDEAAKIQRFLGISSEAGLGQAICLANDKDWAKRNFAAEMLGEIGTPKARRYLETMVKDSDLYMAKASLSVLAKGPMQDAPAAFQLLKQQKPISSR
jgi:hypothetical protein